MIEQLIYFYKSEATTYTLVFRFIKLRYNVFLLCYVIFCLAALLCISGFLMFFITTFRVLYIITIIIFVVSLLICLIMTWYLNKSAKMIVRRKYKIKSTGWIWRTREFDEMQNRIIINYLVRNNLYNENKIKLLIETLNKEIERRKLPSLIAPGIFISLFLPIWVQFMSFQYKTVETISSAIQILVGMTFLVLLAVFLINLTRWMIRELLDTVRMNDVTLRKALIEKLEDIFIQFPLEDRKVNSN